MKKAASLILVLALCLSLCACTGSSNPEKTIEKLYHTTMTADAYGMMALIPDTALKYITEQEFDGDQSEMEKSLKDSLDENIAFLEEEFGRDWQYSYEITSMSDITGSMLVKAQEIYHEKCGLKVREVKVYTLTVTYSGAVYSEQIVGNVVLVKIGNTWYRDILYSEWTLS